MKDNSSGCSPCCKKQKPDPPLLQPSKMPEYPEPMIKPTQGTLPSSKAGFLVSFLVDARGGAMTGHRHWGMRVVIPPGAVQQPTRVNCRYQPLTKMAFPPPFMEREALASRVVEISPAGERFRAPVLIEIPHFASTANAERETVILRSDDGETWTEHVSDYVNSGEIYQDVVTSVKVEDHPLERIYDVLEVSPGRIIRILTSVFPKYFAIISRIREDVRSVGQEGGKVVLDIEPRLRATFPKNAVKKKIKVGLQTQSIPPELVKAAFGRSVEVSRMVAVEPRKRKFHEPIFVSIPLPCLPGKASSANIRLLCSVTGSTEKATWQDVTGSTPLELCKDVVHFSTKVSGTFWLLVIHDKQREPDSALTLANRLYEEAILVPYQARLSVFCRENFPRAWIHTIRIYCMTDDKAEKVIQSLHGFRPLVISGDVEITHSSPIAVRLGGNLMQLRQDPFTSEIYPTSTLRKGGDVKEPFVFRAFEDNCLTLLVQAKEKSEPLAGTVSFSRRLTSISATQQLPMCQLGFDFSSEAAGHCIISKGADPVSVPVPEPSSNPNVPPPPKDKPPVEDEDPYEKIDISASKASTLRVKGKDVEGEEKLAREVAKQLEKKAKAQTKSDKNVTKSELLVKPNSNENSAKKSKGNSKSGSAQNGTSDVNGIEREQSIEKNEATMENKQDTSTRQSNDTKEKAEDIVLSVDPSVVRDDPETGPSVDDVDVERKILDEECVISITKTQLKDSTKATETETKNREVVEEICVETKAFSTTESTEVKEGRSRSKSKTKKFASDDLESMRADFARKQGVKEVLEVENIPKDVASEGRKTDGLDQPQNGGLQKKEGTEEFKDIVAPQIETFNKTPVQHSTSLTRTVSNKSESGSQSRSKSKNKAKKFAANDLEAMRAGFAKQQGVKEVKIVKDLPAAGAAKTDVKQNLEPSHVEDEEVFEEIMSPEEAELLSQENDSSPRDNKKSGEEGDVGLETSMDECKVSGKERIEESEYEEVGHPAKEMCHDNMEQRSHSDILAAKGESKNEKGGVISDIVSDIKDFSSLKRKKSKGKDKTDATDPSVPVKDDHSMEDKEENGCWEHSPRNGKKRLADDYEVMTASSTPSVHIKTSPNDTIVGSASPPIHIKSERDDDIIGFDIKDDVEKEKEAARLADEAQWKPAPAPYEAPDPPRPPVRKSSLAQAKLTSEPVSSTPSLNTIQREKKKSSFIKDWQRDLKEFFSLGMSKKKMRKESEVSQNSSSQPLVGQLSPKSNIAKGEGDREDELLAQNRPAEEDSIVLVDSGDVTEMGKDDVKDVGDEVGNGRCDEGSKEGTGGRRSKRDRRSRRKTNSECSPTPRPSVTSDPGITDDRQAGSGSEEQARTASVSVGENDVSNHLEGKSSPRPNYKREDSILSVGGKPKVVVPSPKGIPKPIPRAKNRESAALKQNRDSVASNDSFNDSPLPLNPASAQQLAKVAAETEELALFSTRRNTAGEGELREVETEEFKRAVDRFDQLYQEEEKEEQKTVVTTSKQETEEQTTVVTKRQKKNKKKNAESCTQRVSVEEQESSQVSEKEGKQIKKGGSFEESPENEEKVEKKSGKSKNKNSSKKKRGRIEGNVEISLDDVHAIAKNISPDEGAAASAEETKTQGIVQVERDFAKEDGDFTEFQKKLIQKTKEAQDSIQSTLLDIETERMESEVMRVQRHSLCVDGGVMVERTTTTLARTESEDSKEEKIILAHTESEESKEEDSQIDPDSLKNVDGQAKTRKGSSRFSKRQNSKSKSPRNSLSTSEGLVGEEAEDSLSNTDLTSRLAQTNERMKKLSATFSSVASRDDSLMERDEWPEEEEVVVSARNSASDQTLVRTTRIRVVDPLDGMIESMIQKPDEASSSPSSESHSTPVASSSPHVYRAVVVQHLDQVETIRSQEVSAMRQRLGLDG